MENIQEIFTRIGVITWLIPSPQTQATIQKIQKTLLESFGLEVEDIYFNIHIPEDLASNLGAKDLPAGKYSIYAVDTWKNYRFIASDADYINITLSAQLFLALLESPGVQWKKPLDSEYKTITMVS